MSDPTPLATHRLDGCRPAPLAHYLKALGILRLIAEQADPAARGWWHDDVFYLSTSLSRQALEDHFLHRYRPTPLLAPWNGGSGFYPKDNQVAIKAIAASSAARFRPYVEAIGQTRALVAGLDAKPDRGETKNAVIAGCRRTLRGPALAWLDAALALGGEGEPVFPAMLGTGGNDGRLDFTVNFMQRITALFDVASEAGDPQAEAPQQLRTALWGQLSPTLASGAIGQFLPGAAGGPNGTTGFSGGIGVNPWDFVLMLEGAVLFSAGLSRRCQARPLPQAAAPFAVRASGSGYGSADPSDAGPRGEQWMPLWHAPTGLRELTALLREGRCQINGRPPGRGIDMARAVAKMGTARGIAQFERYGYIERNGLSNLAIPLGRFQVCPRPNQRLLDEVAPWIDRLRQAAGDKLAPASFQRVHQACELAAFNCAQHARGSDFLSLLMALGKAEDQMLASPKFAAGKCVPIPPLSAPWYPVIAENSAEFRLAVALAGQFGPLDPAVSNDRRRWAEVRQHWLPLDANGRQFLKGENGLTFSPDQAAGGLDLERALLAVMHRRLLALNRGATAGPSAAAKHLPLRLVHDHLGATWPDLEAFLNHRTDDARLLAIARGVMPIRWSETQRIDWQSPAAGAAEPPSAGARALYGILRLALPTDAVVGATGVSSEVTCDASVHRRLAAADLVGAFQLATRRLAVAGLRPKLKVAIAAPQLARRLAASLAFGIDRRTRSALLLTVTAAEEPA